MKYNEEHGITPKTIIKAVEDILEHQKLDAEQNAQIQLETLKKTANLLVPKQRKQLLKALREQMNECAERLEYEEAAAIRDQILDIEKTYGK